MTAATAACERDVDEPERMRILRRGAPSDVEANLLIVRRNVPHRCTLSADLLRVAESLGRR